MMTESVPYITETPDRIARSRVSNLVNLGGHQICDDSITEPHHLVKPSRSQRQNPDRYCLRVADIQESATTNQAFDRPKKPKKKLSVPERPVDRRPQTVLKDSFVPDCVDQVSAGYGSWLTGQFFLTGQVIGMP